MQHHGMEGDEVGAVFGDFPNGGIGGQDDQIEGGAVRDDGDVLEGVLRGLEFSKEFATRAHLLGSFGWVGVGDFGAVMRSGNGDEGFTALRASELLEIIARDESAHAEGNQAEGFIRSEFLFNVFL